MVEAMSSRKRLGYNWKARQQKEKVNEKSRSLKKDKTNGSPELEPSLSYLPVQDGFDTNVEVLPSKKQKLVKEDDDDVHKRKKLSGKQRKRLLKVIEAKEKKAKVGLPN